MQFPVPKDIDLEDKIIGPMTLRQFLYVLVGCSFAYGVLKKIGGPEGNTQLAIMIALPIALFSIALAFVKVQERPLVDFMISLLTFFTRPRQRIWKRQDSVQDFTLDKNSQVAEVEVVKKKIKVSELTDLTKILDE